jgi:recombination protein RecA
MTFERGCQHVTFWLSWVIDINRTNVPLLDVKEILLSPRRNKREARERRLATVVVNLQQRYGASAIQKASEMARAKPVFALSTSFPDLDAALGIGGLPRGRLTEFLGTPTSGIATLALKVTATAQAEGDTAAYIDLGYTFDPDYAARCGVNPARLLLVRPQSGSEALEIVYSLVAGGGVGVLVFDSVSHLLAESSSPQAMAALLPRLASALAGSACALVFLTPLYFGEATSLDNYPSGFALPHYAAVRLLVEKEEWIRKRRDIRGYQARVTVLKNKLAAAGRSVTIAITFDGVVLGNGT